MNWIRVATKIRTSATVQTIADRCKVRRNEAQGAVVGLLCALPDHAKDGQLGAVPDAQLEKWADWEGKKGAFAAAFRAEMCDDLGTVRQWEEINGAAIREAERNAQKAKAYRQRHRDSTGNVPGNGTGNVTAYETRRDETEYTSSSVCEAKKQLAMPRPTPYQRARRDDAPVPISALLPKVLP